MGMDLSTIIGPYIEIKGKHTKSITKVKRVCPKHPKTETNNKFCGICGTEIQSVEYKDVKPVIMQHFIWDKFNDDDDFFSPEGLNHIILPNKSVPGKVRTTDEGAVDLTNCHEIMTKQINWFVNSYADHIKIFKDNFGDENVLIKWGIVSYWS